MSDHISGPRALADPIADITDVYAFPSPEHPGHLVLVMDAAMRVAEKIASNSPTAVQAVKRAAHLGEGQPIEQAIAIMRCTLPIRRGAVGSVKHRIRQGIVQWGGER